MTTTNGNLITRRSAKGYVLRLTESDWAERDDAERKKDEFVEEFGVSEAKLSGHNLTRMLRSTGERPGRIDTIRKALAVCGLSTGHYGVISWGRPFDHVDMWSRDGIPYMIVSHPYGISDEHKQAFASLRLLNALRVSIDDRPSYYGFGTNHIRIEVANPTTPYRTPKSTAKTRRILREFRKALNDEG